MPTLLACLRRQSLANLALDPPNYLSLPFVHTHGAILPRSICRHVYNPRRRLQLAMSHLSLGKGGAGARGSLWPMYSSTRLCMIRIDLH